MVTYAVYGLGRAGVSCIRALRRLKYDVVGFDDKATTVKTLRGDVDDKTYLYHAPSVDVAGVLAKHDVSVIVVSPGISPSSTIFSIASDAGIELIGEVELAWRLQRNDYGRTIPWLAITGTNGKTTTTGMAVSMLKAAGKRAVGVGNIGNPICDEISRDDVDVFVLEASSFQLYTTTSMSPYAAVCLNIGQDHIDWHGSYEAYFAAKASIYERTQVACIYHTEEDETLKMVEEADVMEGARAIAITLGPPAVAQVGIVEDMLVDRAFIHDYYRHGEILATFKDFKNMGGCTRALLNDALAAAALVRALGVEADAVAQGLRQYTQAPHRRAVVGWYVGLTWIDDSKATNAHAAEGSLKGMREKSVIWIVGGDAKGQDFHELVRNVKDCLRAVIIIGKDQSAFECALRDEAPDVTRVHIKDLEENETLETLVNDIVHTAISVSVPGNTVILAPACASWDQFASYSQRGDMFAAAVRSLS